MAGAVAAAILAVLMVAAPAYATVYIVGDSQGWSTGVDYTTWTSGKTFNVGDTLEFQYSPLHSVDEVSASDYSACSTSNSLNSYNDQDTKIPLTAAGTRYFVCGTLGHCGNGMKLAVTVAAGSTPSTPTTPSTTPTTPSTTPSTPGGSHTPTTPSTPDIVPVTPTTGHSNGASGDGLAGGKAVLVAGALVAGVVALMG